jgi:hypothetical protein
MSLTKVSYSMVTGAPANVLDFGADLTGVADSTAAINAALAASDIVYMPPGIYKTTSSINVSANQQLYGASSGTIIRSTLASGVAAIVVGNPANNALSYGCVVRDLIISPQVDDTVGVMMYSLVGASVKNIEIQPYDVITNTTGFVLDGGYSAFFNLFENLLCNHCHIGFKLTTTGVSYPTCQTFINFSSFGDLQYGDTTSSGFLFENVATNSCGQDSVIVGGNVEQCGTGVSIVNINSLTFNGLRFEQNTVDVLFGTFTQFCNFISCKYIENVSGINWQNGYGKNSFISCNGAYGIVNRQESTSIIYSKGAAEIPVIIAGYTGQTAPYQQWKNSSGTVLAAIEDGAIRVNSGAKTVGANEISIGSITATTVGAAGGASALPATPVGYLIMNIGGTDRKIPYYNT